MARAACGIINILFSQSYTLSVSQLLRCQNSLYFDTQGKKKPKSSSKIELIFQFIRSQTGYNYYYLPVCSSGKKIVPWIKSPIIYLGAKL